MRLATNASLLDKEMGSQLAECGLDYVKISLEALSDEGYRKICGANIKYNDIVDNISNLHNREDTNWRENRVPIHKVDR